jgi:hypothetical protein
MANRKRKFLVGIMVTERERTQIQQKVVLSKLSQREYIMRCVADREIHVKQGGHEVVVELKRIGNNLNQLTFNANAGRITDCRPELQNIYAELREVRKIWQ